MRSPPNKTTQDHADESLHDVRALLPTVGGHRTADHPQPDEAAPVAGLHTQPDARAVACAVAPAVAGPRRANADRVGTVAAGRHASAAHAAGGGAAAVRRRHRTAAP